MKADDLLDNVRKFVEEVISDPTEVNAGLDLADSFKALDEFIISNHLLPKDWEVGKKLIWRDGQNGSKILMLNGAVVGHAFPGSTSGWLCQTDMIPTREFPYMIKSRLLNEETMEMVMEACEIYVREQIKNVFDPWEVLRNEGLI
jgi:hypothetical protein